MSQPLTASVNRTWVLKTGGFMIVLLGLGLWGLYDGLYLYPKRGMQDASFQFNNFLKEADAAGYLTSSNITVADPKAARAEMRARASEYRTLAAGTSAEARKAKMELAKLNWLDSLHKAWQLNATPKFLGSIGAAGQTRRLYFDMAKGEGYTVEPGGTPSTLSPQATLNELTKFWDTNNKVSPLSAYDMAFQWLIVVVGFGGAMWILLTIFRTKAAARLITFEPETQRLTLPGNVSLVPADLKDIDKRKWNKFYCTLETDKGNHEVDLLRYVPLEEWVLTMEKTRFPERAAEAEREKAEQDRQAAEAARAIADSGSSNPTTTTPNT